MDRYLGLDVHSASCTSAVLNAQGKRLSSTVIETNGKALVEFLRMIPGTRHLIIEEGTIRLGLHEILSPHVHEMVVMSVPKSKGQKNDKVDAFSLAEKLRMDSIDGRVYKGVGEFSTLSSMSRAYRSVVVDSVSVMNRLKGVFRARGVSTAGRQVFGPKDQGPVVEEAAMEMTQGLNLPLTPSRPSGSAQNCTIICPSARSFSLAPQFTFSREL